MREGNPTTRVWIGDSKRLMLELVGRHPSQANLFWDGDPVKWVKSVVIGSSVDNVSSFYVELVKTAHEEPPADLITFLDNHGAEVVIYDMQKGTVLLPGKAGPHKVGTLDAQMVMEIPRLLTRRFLGLAGQAAKHFWNVKDAVAEERRHRQDAERALMAVVDDILAYAPTEFAEKYIPKHTDQELPEGQRVGLTDELKPKRPGRKETGMHVAEGGLPNG